MIYSIVTKTMNGYYIISTSIGVYGSNKTIFLVMTPINGHNICFISLLFCTNKISAMIVFYFSIQIEADILKSTCYIFNKTFHSNFAFISTVPPKINGWFQIFFFMLIPHFRIAVKSMPIALLWWWKTE